MTATPARPDRSLEGRRILFLGSAYHPLSVACLEALAAGGAFVTVVADDALRSGRRAALARVFRHRGGRAVLRRITVVARAKSRLAARRRGVRLPGPALSMAEVTSTYSLVTMDGPDPNDPAFVERLRALSVDLIVVANYPRILRRPLLDAAAHGAINIHPSLLPAYRGPDPLYWALARGARETGVTVHVVDEGIDTGPVIAQSAFPIAARDDETTLLVRAAARSALLVREAAALVLSGQVVTRVQPVNGASYFGRAPRGASSL